MDASTSSAGIGLWDSAHPKYRPDIDGLRAIAVLSVMIYHAFPAKFRGGFIGVDIFFVISGFLISTIIFKSLEINKFSFVDFYSRRIRRIFPALAAVLLATSALAGSSCIQTTIGSLANILREAPGLFPISCCGGKWLL